MEGFTIIDGGVALVIVVSALLAYARGFVREIMAIAGWIVAAIVGYMFAKQVEPLIREAPVVGEFIGDNCVLSTGAAFFAVFVVALILMSFFTPLFSSLIHRSAAGGVDQGLGFLFGIVRGVVLIAIAFFIYTNVMNGQDYPMVDDSRSAEVFAQLNDEIQKRQPEQVVDWVKVKFDALMSECGE